MTAPEQIWIWPEKDHGRHIVSEPGEVYPAGSWQYRRADLPPTDADYAALQARVAELETHPMVLVELRDELAGQKARAEAAEALLPEAVKAGMLEGAKLIAPKGEQPDVDPSNTGDIREEAFWLADRNASTRIRALASEPASIAYIVAKLKEGRG